MQRLNLYEQLKPECKESIAKDFINRPHSHDVLIRALSNEYYFTSVSYGDAFDIMSSCNLDFLGDAFDKNKQLNK